MSDIETATIFMHDGSQAVRLPTDFRLPGREVRVRRVGYGIMLEPIARSLDDIRAISAELDRLNNELFMPEGRCQPPMPDMSDINLDE